MKTTFTVYMHSESMISEIEADLMEREGLDDHPDLSLIVNMVSNFTCEVGIIMEWDDETKKLAIVGIE